ncbi:MAG: UDP-3-O-(3-hydroxymyristoyl)glucosamine N-acyltransferase [Cyanobacteria bacterium SZAS-4]|nr:UDP-3-O-(3-hydroxymyristoyl)glucosamine N-acyltransferase [Cyanobacteria bacterium SZAS-4]
MKLPSEMSLAQIAQLIGGKVHGSDDVKISSFSPSAAHAGSGDIALIADTKVLRKLAECKASALIVPSGSDTKLPLPLIFVDRPMLAVQRILTALQPKWFRPAGIHPSAVIDPTAEIAEGVNIGALVAVGAKSKIGKGTTILAGTMIGGAVKIGEDCLLHQGCMVGDFVEIGNRVILQQGVSLGGDGFGYVTERPSNMELLKDGLPGASDEPNPLLKIPHIGNVILHDDVEIGSNSTIDRGTVGPTVIGKGTKIDNQVQIAHNCQLGRENIIVAHACMGGSTTLGDRAIVAGASAIKDHIKIGKDAVVEAAAAVMKNIDDGDVQIGVPSTNAKAWFNEIAHIKKLPKLNEEFRALKKKVEELEKQLSK